MAVEVLGASHLAQANYEIQRVNNFEIQIPHVVRPGGTTSTLTLAVVSGFLPHESNEVITLNYGNSKVTVAGIGNLNNSGTLVVRDFLEPGSDVEELIDIWRESVQQKTDVSDDRRGENRHAIGMKDSIGFASNYKKSAQVIQYAPDGTYERIWDLEGVWPSEVDYGALSYDNPGIKTISITLQYDRAILNRKDYNTEIISR